MELLEKQQSPEASGSTPASIADSEVVERLAKEQQLRLKAEEEVTRLTQELSGHHGKQFDLMTLTGKQVTNCAMCGHNALIGLIFCHVWRVELEVKLEDAQRSLVASEQRNEHLQANLDKVTQECKGFFILLIYVCFFVRMPMLKVCAYPKF